MDKIDFKKILESAAGCYLILLPDAKFTIVGVTNAYAEATMTKREVVVGQGLFDVFPDNPNDHKATGVANLTASLNRVIANKAPDQMAIQKYDIPIKGSKDGGFEERYWSPKNYPVLDEQNNLSYIIHTVTDVTKSIKLEQSQAVLSEKVKMADLELFEKIQELEKMNLFMASRELKVEELKKENEELRKKLAM